MTGRKLVIVESPAKARTISGYLGSDYTVEASVGHIRDLPQPSALPEDMKKGPYGKFAVNVEDDFQPYYVVDPSKKKKVSELKKLLKDADELYLATDEDREGEAIAWHLLQVLKPKIPVYRMVFHEITKEAIDNALKNTRDINENLVDAQETRRILDRLVGYEISPLLWRKVKVGLSAGRVQSVATRMIVDRERERMEFVSAKYYGIEGNFSTKDMGFSAKLVKLDEQKIATGKDFDDSGKLSAQALKQKVVLLDKDHCERLVQALQAVEVKVENIEDKPYRRNPAAPFTTSTLQQEASRKLRMNSRETMRVAQFLYENGYITYMRTDSTALSEQAVNAARAQATILYGSDCIPEKPRVYANKTKGAQEAHEAIRPSGDYFRTPAELSETLSKAELALYDLIWKRTVASQMLEAKGTTSTVTLGAQTPEGKCVFTVSGTVITQKGFLNAYEEGQDTSRYASDDKQVHLPPLQVGESVGTETVDTVEHSTAAPPRYTEASLVKTLEEHGIGRPSTYASIIAVIIDRGYVLRKGQALVPSWLAFSVVNLLETHLSQMVDYDFTAQMETDLDKIADGTQERTQWLKDFYNGTPEHIGLHQTVENLGDDIDARAVNTVQISDKIVLRNGRFGPYIELVDDEEKRVSVPADLAPDEVTPEKAMELLTATPEQDRVLGTDPQTNLQIVVKDGRFGPYVTEILPEDSKEKPRNASLFKSMKPDTVTLQEAVQLLNLPRILGVRESDNEQITAQNGRFGPYIKCGKDTRTLETEEQIFTITQEEALQLLAEPKGRRRAAATAPLKEFGIDPESEKPVVIKDGRFGPYITDGKTNVTVPKSTSIENISAEMAYELLAEKRAKTPVKRTAKKATKAKTTKKSTKTKTSTKTKA